MHIRQKSSGCYTVVNTENYILDLSTHPCLQFPDLFELCDQDPPEGAQVLNFQVAPPDAQ